MTRVKGTTMAYGLGIDCGTTHIAAAVTAGGRCEVLRLGARRPEIPSLVFVPADGPVLVGDAAARRGEAEPGRLAREVKRRIGDPVPILVSGAPYPAHALMARQIEYVLHTAEALHGGPPSSVVITCPANWGPYKRDLLRQAARLADAPAVSLRTEPEAAAIEYAAGERMSDGDVVAVYDLGGGTFDAAVLRREGDGFAVLGEPEGIEQLGGMDFDEAVFDHVVSTLPMGELPADDDTVVAALARLRRDCVEAKEALSEDTEVLIPVALPKLHTRVRLNRAEFEAMVRPALTETLGAMQRALRSAGVRPEEVRSILLSGGSSRIPLVAELLSGTFGRPVVLDPHPELSIALGAARVSPSPPHPAPATTAALPATAPSPSPSRATAPVPVRAVATAAVAAPAVPAPRDRATGAASTGSTRTGAGPIRAGAGAGRTRLRRRIAIGLTVVAVLAVTGIAAVLLRPDPPLDEGAAASSAGATSAAAAAAAPACGFTDDSGRTTADDAWERARPDTGLVVAGGMATLDAPDGADIYADKLAAPMLLRRQTGDFAVETEVTVRPTQFYQGAGLVIWSGPRLFVRLERGFGDVGAIVYEYRNGAKHTRPHPPWSTVPGVVKTDADQVVLRLERAGDTVRAAWRPVDSGEFRDLGTIEAELPDTVKIGVSVLNRAQNGAKPAVLSAGFERVTVTC